MTERARFPGPGSAVLAAVAILAAAVYANSLGNGFAFDDRGVIVDNPVVTSGDAVAALGAPYWAGEAGLGLLYRPATQAAFALQWRLFGGEAAGFHAVAVVLHALASVLVALLCGWLVGIARPLDDPLPEPTRRAAILAGGAVFAVHPVHVEAVANVVGQAELLSAVGVLCGVWVHLETRHGGAALRVAGTLALGLLFALAFGAKEVGIVLPALLLLVEAAESSGVRAFGRRVMAEMPRAGLLAAVGLAVLAARGDVLGSLTGEQVTAVLWGLDPWTRLARVLPVWGEYLRLMVWPLDLSADYDPGVIYPASGPAVAQVVAGAAVLGGVVALVVYGWRRTRRVAVAGAWFVLAVLPVSNLLVPTGSIMAERTLYLPSAAWALAAAVGFAAWVHRGEPGEHRIPRPLVWASAVAIVLLAARTVVRTPTWFSSFTVMETLARDHPESWRASMARAQGLVRAGDDSGAAEAFRRAVAALPTRYDAVHEAGVFFKARGRLSEARPYLESTVVLDPERPSGWVHLAELELLEGRYREAHAVATRGIARARADGELWALLSESYVGGGLLDAAIRARRTALALEPDVDAWWARLVELLEASGAEPSVVEEARRRGGTGPE